MAEETGKIIEELEQAYRTEVDGYVFYKKAGAMVDDARGRNIFKHLAMEELDHMNVVSAIARSLREGSGWTPYEKALKVGGEGAPVFPAENELTERLSEGQDDIKAVEIGIEIEEKAVDFYSKLLRKAEEPDEKVVLTKLLEMEKNHLKLLRWERESLVSSGFWCDMMEFSVEKEME